MQLFGLAAIVLLLPDRSWGWRLLAHRPLGDKWRGLLWILGTFLAAGFVSSLPRIGSWPLPTGLGGVIGDALLRAPAWVMGHPLHGLSLLIAGLAVRRRHRGDCRLCLRLRRQGGGRTRRRA